MKEVLQISKFIDISNGVEQEVSHFCDEIGDPIKARDRALVRFAIAETVRQLIERKML